MTKKASSPVLKGKITTYVEVDSNDLDTFVNKVYGVNSYECVAMEEWSNDTKHQVRVTSKEPLDKWAAEKIQEIKAGRCPSWSIQAVMQDLVNEGHIQPGIYLINVSW
jgi:hypothetical protein